MAENFFKEDESEEESIDGPSPMEVDNEKEDSVTNELVEPSPGEDEPANPNPTMDVEQPVDLVTEPTLPGNYFAKYLLDVLKCISCMRKVIGHFLKMKV